jgi:hypothetical protein
LFVANSIIARAELSAQMIASLDLFVIDGISGSVSRVAIIYIGIALYIYVKKPIFKMFCFFVESPAFSEKMSCFYNNPSSNPSHRGS